MPKPFFLLLIITVMLSDHSFAQKKDPPPQLFINQKNSLIIADAAKLQLVSDQFSFTEGPATDKNGNVFFTDQPNNKIWKYSTAGKLTVFLDKAGRSNGMYFDQQGNLISCADEENQLWQIAPNGTIKILAKDFEGHHFNGPNDVWVSPIKGMYFTDPYYQRDYWTRKSPELDGQKLYYLEPGKKPQVAADHFVQPNGLVGSADGKWLYVADIGDNKTYRYQIASDGSLKNRELFVTMGSDGMTIDQLGNIYLTGNGVTVFNKQGIQIEHIPIPEEWTGNIVFGGKEKNLLFITASKSVYILAMKVKGVY